MLFVKHYHIVPIFLQLLPIDAVYSTRACLTFPANCRKKLHYHHAAYIVVLILAGLLYRAATMSLLDATKRVL